MSIRTERVAGEVKRAVAQLFQVEFSSLTDGLITVTQVRMSPDLRSGRVYLSILGGTVPQEKVLKQIKEIAPLLRTGIARAVRLRVAPELFYYIDDTEEEVAKMEAIFKKIRESGTTQASSEPTNSEPTNE